MWQFMQILEKAFMGLPEHLSPFYYRTHIQRFLRTEWLQANLEGSLLRAKLFIIEKHSFCTLDIFKALPSAPNFSSVQLQISALNGWRERESIFKFVLNLSWCWVLNGFGMSSGLEYPRGLSVIFRYEIGQV